METNQPALPLPLLLEVQGALRSALLACQAEALGALRHHAPEGPDLGGGCSGQALLMAYAAKALGAPDLLSEAMALLERGVETIRDRPRPPLYGGFTGLAWTIEHLQPWLREATGDEDDVNAEVDEALLDLLHRHPWREDYDLVGGLVGYGIYALERMPRPSARRLLELILGHFEALATPFPDGISWHTPPHRLPPWQRALAPEGYFNQGLAHGTPGIVGLLGAMVAWGVEEPRARQLLEQAMAWIQARAQDPVHGAYLPTWVIPGDPKPEEGTRIAWCYGDLGAGLAILQAARCAQRPDWEAFALDMLRLTAQRPLADASINDACLCHGAAGNALLYYRAFQTTGEAPFREAALRYLQTIVDLHTPGQGTGGWLAYHPDRRSPEGQELPPLVADPSFLEGTAGIALVLLTFLQGIEPHWDRAMMASLRLPS